MLAVTGLQPREHVVPQHHRNAELFNTQFARHPNHLMPGSQRIGRAHVADDFYAVGNAGGQHGPHARSQQRVKTKRRVLAALQLGQRYRALGQAFKYQVVQLAAFSQFKRWGDAVTGVTRASTDTQCV